MFERIDEDNISKQRQKQYPSNEQCYKSNKIIQTTYGNSFTECLCLLCIKFACDITIIII